MLNASSSSTQNKVPKSCYELNFISRAKSRKLHALNYVS